MKKFAELYYLIDTLTVLEGVKSDKIIHNLYKLLELLIKGEREKEIYPEALKYYTEMCSELYKREISASLPNCLYDLILYNENAFSSMCAGNKYHEVSAHITEALKKDIKTLRLLASVGYEELVDALIKNNPALEAIQDSLPAYSSNFRHAGKKDIWEDYIGDFVRFCIKNGTGQFAKHFSFRLDDSGKIIPVVNPDKIRLRDLKLYESQKQKANNNILAFLTDSPCNNVLMYGDRGTGKSSCVKALANEYAEVGLRIIQVEKKKLKFMSDLMQTLSTNPMKFLIFIDDLTFCEDDESFNALKAVLEGSLSTQPVNTVIYATSNRKHIIKETFSAREGDEIHLQDTIDEAMSLSDRFGLMITYQMPGRDAYIEITRQMAEDRNIIVPLVELAEGAERFALSKGSRSPRIAKQFLDFTYTA